MLLTYVKHTRGVSRVSQFQIHKLRRFAATVTVLCNYDFLFLELGVSQFETLVSQFQLRKFHSFRSRLALRVSDYQARRFLSSKHTVLQLARISYTHTVAKTPGFSDIQQIKRTRTGIFLNI